MPYGRLAHESPWCQLVGPGDWTARSLELVDCPQCLEQRARRLERDRQRDQARRRRAVRLPPKPWEQPGHPGGCSLCSSPIPKARRRTWCSQECVDLWHLATFPAAATAQLLELQGQRCWKCGETREATPLEPWEYEPRPWLPDPRPRYGPPGLRPVTLELDHVRPLWSLTDLERQELRWWLPGNLQLLCGPCHAAKTRLEAGQRAQVRRAAAAEA